MFQSPCHDISLRAKYGSTNTAFRDSLCPLRSRLLVCRMKCGRLRSTDDLSVPNTKFVFEVLVHFKEREMQGLVDKIIKYVTIAP